MVTIVFVNLAGLAKKSKVYVKNRTISNSEIFNNVFMSLDVFVFVYTERIRILLCLFSLDLDGLQVHESRALFRDDQRSRIASCNNF